VLQSDTLDALWRTSLKLAEIAEPAAPAANQAELYLLDNGVGPKVMVRDEYGLRDILSRRNAYRTRVPFWFGLGSDAAAAADSLHMNMNISTTEGTWSNNAATTTVNPSKRTTTGATANNDGGVFSVGFTRRNMNPDVTIKFQVNSLTLRRVWIGWVNSDHMPSDTDGTIGKFAMRLSTAPAVTGFVIVHSSGTSDTVEAEILAADAAVHTIRLVADDANARFGYSFDGAAITWIGANIPAANGVLIFQMQIRTLEAVAKNMDVFWVDGSHEA